MTRRTVRVLAVLGVLFALSVPVAGAAEPESIVVPIDYYNLFCDGIQYDSGNPNHHVVPSPDGLQLFDNDGHAVVDVSEAAGPQVIFGVWDDGAFDEYAFWTGNLIIGSAYDDVICAGPNSEDDVFGGGGNDRIFAENSGAVSDDLYGGPGDDVLYAGFSPNDVYDSFEAVAEIVCVGPSLFGNVGDDLLIGDDCVNWIWGGGGADEIHGGGAFDYLYGGGGTDEMYGGEGDDAMYGGDNADLMDGEDGWDYLYGNSGADTLIGGLSSEASDPTPAAIDAWVPCDETNDGNDEIYGGVGPDTIYGGDGADIIAGYDGADTIYGECGDDRAYGNKGGDSISGGPGNDYLEGNTQSDTLTGDADVDEIHGGRGDDTADGGAGDDSVFGEGGSDTLNGGAGSDSVYGMGGHDAISGGDGPDYLNGWFGNDDLYDDTPASPGDGDEDYLQGDWGDDTYTSACADVDDTAYEGADEGENDQANQFYQDELTPTDDYFEVIFSCVVET